MNVFSQVDKGQANAFSCGLKLYIHLLHPSTASSGRPNGSLRRNRNTRHANLRHRQTVHTLQHHLKATSSIIHRPEEIFRLRHPAGNSYIPSRCHSTSLTPPEIMVFPYHLQSAADRKTKKSLGTLPSKHQPSERSQMAEHQRLANFPQPT